MDIVSFNFSLNRCNDYVCTCFIRDLRRVFPCFSVVADVFCANIVHISSNCNLLSRDSVVFRCDFRGKRVFLIVRLRSEIAVPKNCYKTFRLVSDVCDFPLTRAKTDS